MTVTLANEIRPTEMPMYCSACAGQYPDRRHVDFDAAVDRGYVKHYGSVMVKGQSVGELTNATAIPMEDLILCEECLKIGAQRLGMIDAEDWQTEKATLEARVESAEKLAERESNYASRMEDTLRHRPGGDPVDHRIRPRKAVA